MNGYLWIAFGNASLAACNVVCALTSGGVLNWIAGGFSACVATTAAMAWYFSEDSP